MHKIKAIVGINNITLSELSACSGIDLTALFRMLKRGQSIKIEHALRLALSLDLDTDLSTFFSQEEFREIKYDVIPFKRYRGEIK